MSSAILLFHLHIKERGTFTYELEKVIVDISPTQFLMDCSLDLTVFVDLWMPVLKDFYRSFIIDIRDLVLGNRPFSEQLFILRSGYFETVLSPTNRLRKERRR